MKKFFAALLAVMMVLTMVVVPTFAAEGDMTFTACKTQGFKNNEVTFTIDVSNNIGMTGVIITVCYDKTVLSYVPKEESYISGEIFSSAPQVGDVSDGCQFVYADATETAKNGKLITLTFEISDTAAVDTEYPVSLIVRECIDDTNAQLTTSVVAGGITVVEPKAEISDWNIALDESVTVNYYATIDAPFAGAQMQFTMNGYTLDPVDGTLVKDNVYVYSFNGVAPHRMGDAIKADLVYNEEVKDTKTASVADYCDAIVGKTAAELGISDAKFAALETLVADLLEYGATAQVYNDYKTNALVSEIDLSDWVDIETSYLEDNYLYFYEESGCDSAITAAGVEFFDVNSLYFKFILGEGVVGTADEGDFKIEVTIGDGDTVEYYIEDCELIDEATGTYILFTDALLATDYSAGYVIELFGLNNRGRLTSMQYIEYSVAAYVWAMQNSDNAAMANLAKALYNYGVAAEAYVNA